LSARETTPDEATRAPLLWWRSLHFKVTFYQVMLMAGLICATFTIMFTVERTLLVENGQDLQEQMGKRVISDLQNRIYLTESLATALANLGESLTPDESVYRQVVPRVLDYENRGSFIAGGGIWPEPYKFDPAAERRSFFWGRMPDGSLKYYDDYNRPGGAGYHHEEWYAPAAFYKPGQAYWSKSYMDPYSYQPMVTCTVPMWRQEEFLGVATVDIKLEGLREFLDEASQKLGGYILVVDRNNKFLSFPKPQVVTREYRDESGNTAQDFLTADELAKKVPTFAPIADALRDLSRRDIEAARSQRRDFDRLVRRVTQQSYQIDEDEARNIVTSMLQPEDTRATETLAVRRLFLERASLLDEPVMVSIFKMPQTHWKIVAVTPMSKFYASADTVTWQVGAYVLALEISGFLVMFFLIRKRLIRPLRQLSNQVRNSDEHGDQLKLTLNDHSRDELGQLAYEFNHRSYRLTQTLNDLQLTRDELENRVIQRTNDLSESERRYQLAVTGSRDGIWDWDLLTDCIYYAPQWKKMLGIEAEDVSDLPDEWISRIDERDLGAFMQEFNGHLSGQDETFEVELRMIHKSGGTVWMLCRGAVVRDETGRATRVAGSMADITEIKHAQDELRRLAEHDRLTGLPNRELFNTRLSEALRRGRTEPDFKFAVLFFDFDRFKIINDSLGHNVGDALLIDIAKQFEYHLRHGDTAARFGGDEFVVLLNDLADYEEAFTAADRLLDTFAKPHDLLGNTVTSTASIGLVTNESPYTTAGEMLRDADAAMYQAKAAGKARVVVFDQKMHRDALDTLQLEADLRDALSRRELKLLYQPIVSLEAGVIVGFEALLRWEHPTRGHVPPDKFIPIAEDTGLIVPIGEWVLHEACQQLYLWNHEDRPELPISVNVNLSMRQVCNPGIVETVRAAILDSGIDPRFLKLEVTESTIVDERHDMIPLLNQIKALGIQLAMDDFGTGHSSLGNLHRLPIDILKIDQSFIKSMSVNRELVAVLQTIITLAHVLGMQTVAEGIETSDQLVMLQALDCNFGQGYYFHKPLNAQAATRYLLGLDGQSSAA